MKLRLIGATVAVAASVLIPQQVHALQVTTAFVPFKAFSNSALNTPASLSFENFNAVKPAGALLKGVGFKISGASNGTGGATVSGNPRISNQTDSTDIAVTGISYSLAFITKANSANTEVIAGFNGNATGFNCVASQLASCGGGSTIPGSTTKTLNLVGTYSGQSPSFAAITNGEILAYSTGTITGIYAAQFNGSPTTDMAFGFDPTVTGSVLAKPNIDGYAALVYEYDFPPVPGSSVPGPLPIIGAASAFAWTRRIRKRIAALN
jgi:hypothetical protein